jgi:hypothetical protein
MHTPATLGRTVNHMERLWPGPGLWAVVVAFAAGLGVALIPVSLATAVIVCAAALVTGVALAVTTTPRVAVADGELTAGAAHIPLSLLGEVTVLDREGIRTAMGPELDARAYVCLRSWIGRGIRVELIDPADPTPYWIVSSRRPGELAAAIRRAHQRPTTEG